MKKYISIPTWIILFVVIFGFGFFIGQTSQPSIDKVGGLTNKELGQPANVDFSLFWDAWHMIEKGYVDRLDLDIQKMIYGSVKGLFESLEDPYTVFMEPEQSKIFLDDMKGSFEGIGAEIGIRKGILTIISPLEGNPAQKAGLKPGDKILKVDDTLTADLSLDQAVGIIRGDKGTEVILLIIRDEWDETREIKIIRDTIEIPIIKWEKISLDNEDEWIAYIQLYHFTENSANQFRKTVKQALEQNPKGIVLDVRNNPGGYLEVAVDIASWFLPKGELVVAEDYGNGYRNEHRSKGYESLENIPTIILINEGSASASEILAGALRDIKGIKIVGQKSFGKGSVQQLEKLKGGSSAKITVAKWVTPAGTNISKEGIIPDEEVELTSEDIDEMRDPQLDKAIELLK
ncbi:MAG: S41 family peptidase [Parcubacteria group bacterium]|nr:S41 family peptidase [Parcubacteria group bacterium]